MTYEYEQYLAHHGIKGQKWGVRRYQNEDGSLTDEGIRRYQKETYSQLKELSKINSKERYSKLSERMSEGVPEEVLARHRKKYNDMADAESRYQRSLTIGKKSAGKDYEKFLNKHDDYLKSLQSDVKATLGKYSGKKLTEMKGRYKNKQTAETIISAAINRRLWEERENKKKKPA